MDKIIDFEKKGNVVRFYLGDINCKNYWGDDWDDRPYEHNAGTVYSEFVTGYIDVAFPYDCDVLEPADDWRYNGNSPFCKEDFKKRYAPCIVVLPPEIVKENYCDDNNFGKFAGAAGIPKFYFEDLVETIEQCTIATVLAKGKEST